MEVTTGTDPQADTHSAWINNTKRKPQKAVRRVFLLLHNISEGLQMETKIKPGSESLERQCLRTMAAASIVYSHSVNHTLRSAIPELSPTDLKTFWRLNASGRRF